MIRYALIGAVVGIVTTFGFMSMTNNGTTHANFGISTQASNVSMDCSTLARFSDDQKEVIRKSIEIGEKENLGYTLAAIAIQESQAGMYVVNARTQSYGPFHIHLKTALSRLNKSNAGDFVRNQVASRLVNDIEFSAKHAIAEIHYWQKVRGNKNWTEVLASYNGGWEAMKKSESRHYAQVVSATVKQLQTCSV